MSAPTTAKPTYQLDADLLRRNVPAELHALALFVTWEYEWREDKWTKPPRNPATGAPADTTQPQTWGTLEAALGAAIMRRHAGIGLVLHPATLPLTGIDLDHCVQADGTLTEEAQRTLAEADSYSEFSPSGTGVHIYCRGAKPPGSCKDQPRGLEMYNTARYLTLTGRRVPGSPATINERGAALARIHARWFPPAPTPAPAGTSAGLSDAELLDKARNARNGAKFRALFDVGDIGAYGQDDSAADEALACLLIWWTNHDTARAERLFWQSALARRDKWAKRADYRQRSLTRADRCVMGGYTGQAGDEPPAEMRDPRPAVRFQPGRDHEAIRAMVDHIAAAQTPDPYLFAQDGQTSLFTLASVPQDGAPRRLVIPAGPAHVRDAMTETVRFEKWNERKNDWAPASPAEYLVAGVAARLAEHCPSLAGITEIPVFRPNGTLQTAPGYDPVTRQYYEPAPGLTIPPVPDTPTAGQVAAARSLIIGELIPDFPFAGPAEQANAVALFVLPYAKPFIRGSTPLHLIESPTPGSGKGLLAEVLLRPALGTVPTDSDKGSDEAEMTKWLIGQALARRPVCYLDNLRASLDSGVLSSAITSSLLSGRKLGENTSLNLPYGPIWVATGNNPAITEEIARRVVRIRLEPDTDRPGQRPLNTFKHPLPEWADTHRAALVHAGLVLVRAWVAAGRPDAPHHRNKGSFTSWARVMGGILALAGLESFLANEDEVMSSASTDSGAEVAFVTCWAEHSGYTGRDDAKDLLPYAEEAGLIAKDATGSPTRRLGRLLGRLRGRRFELGGDVITVVQLPGAHGVKQWGLRRWQERRSPVQEGG